MEEPLKVLIIEDDEVDTLTVKRSLFKAGANAVLKTAMDGEQGMKLAKGEHFDCIFLDYLLPGKDGLSLLKEIRDFGITTPIVIITSQGDENVAVEMMKAGASDYIPKSLLTPDGLSKTLKNAMRMSEMERERRRTKEQLREKEEQLRLVIQNSPIVLFALDAGGNFLLSEGHGLKKLGIDPGQLVGTSALEFYKEYEEITSNLRKSLKGENVTFTSSVQNIWFQTNLSPIRGEKGGVKGVFGVSSDITERIESEKALERAKEKAEKLARIKQDFLANMSHEIRTPMNAIMGFTKLLAKTGVNDEQAQYLKNINSAGDTLMAIINDILDLSKIEAGKLSFEEKDFDLHETLDQVMDIFRAQSSEKGLFLKKIISPNTPKVVIGDKVRLNQVLINLVGNAIKFTENGGVTLIVNTLTLDEGKVRLELQVKDTGIGIDPEKQEAIFQSFNQASTDTTRKFGGTGLGLTICKRLIELQGGTIGVRSEWGSGATFFFDIEYKMGKSDDLEAALESRKVNTVPRPDISILLVEDNLMNQMLAKKVLSDFGFPVTIAGNGKEAVDILRENAFDVVLMDVQMPVMDGYEATSTIRNELPAPRSETPIIALTAHAISEEIDRCLKVGMNDFATKPFEPEDLYEKIVNASGKPELVIVENMQNNPLNDQENNSGPWIDFNYIDELSGGDENFKTELINLFLSSAPEALKSINTEFNNGNWEGVYQAAHSVKPSYQMFTINEGYEILEKILSKVKSSDNPGDMGDLVKRLTQVTDYALEELRETLKG